MRLLDGINDEMNPSWPTVHSALLALPGLGPDRYITLQVDDDTWMIAYHVPKYGFLITAHAEGDSDYYTLIDRQQGSECVRVWCAGEYMERLRLVFVDQERAVQALKFFFDTRRRDSALEWELDDKCWCRGTFDS